MSEDAKKPAARGRPVKNTMPDPRTRLPLAVVEADQLVDEPLGVGPSTARESRR